MTVDTLFRKAELRLENSRKLDGKLPLNDFGWIHLGHDVESVTVTLPDGARALKLVCHSDGDVSSLPDESGGAYIPY